MTKKRILTVSLSLVMLLLLALPLTTAQDDDLDDDLDDYAPALVVTTFISVDNGATWVDAAALDDLEDGTEILYQYIVTYNGEQALTEISLSSTVFDITECEVPNMLGMDEFFVCVVGPFVYDEDEHESSVIVGGMVGEEEIVAIETVGEPEEPDLDIVIVVEGPVSQINANVIVIYNFEFELDPEDPVLTIIQVGDVLLVEAGILAGDGNNLSIVVVNIVFISVEVYVNVDGIVWRDSQTCNNPPPPWAPANGWRNRCESSDGGSNNDSKKDRDSGSRKGSGSN